MDKFDPREYWQNRGTNYPVTVAKMEDEMAHLASWLKVHPGNILEVGSGWGRVYAYLKANGLAADYKMVDFVDSMREGCQQKTGILPDKWDGRLLPYPDKSFDLVLSVEVLLHVPPADIARILAEHARVSRQWLYIVTVGTCYKPLGVHCFWHDYLRLFSDTHLYVIDAHFFRRGLRVHWILEKFK